MVEKNEKKIEIKIFVEEYMQKNRWRIRKNGVLSDDMRHNGVFTDLLRVYTRVF